MAMERGVCIPPSLWVIILLLLGSGTRIVAQSVQSAASFTLGASLGSNQSWVSQNGTFTMGFCTIPANSSSLYLGVWYSGVPVAPVWLANAERAVKSGAILALTNAGNLVLLDADGVQVWQSNTSASGIVSGGFLDNGNIQLWNASDATMWDSFDYPTDTFLPGMVVTVGRKFTSWRANDDPSYGLYTFEMTANGELHYMWNGSEIYYNSGPWAGAYFTNPPQLGRTTPPDHFYFDNSTGNPRLWYTTCCRSATTDISLKRFRLDPDGVARQHIWVIGSNSWQTFISAPVDPCDSIRVCGKNSLCTSNNYIPSCSCLPDFRPVNITAWNDQEYWLQGCGRTDPLLSCTNNATNADSFMTLAGATLQESGGGDVQTFFNATESTCRERCAQNCSCSGYSFSGFTGSLTNCTLHSTSAVLYNARPSNDSSVGNNSTPFMLRYQAIPSQLEVNGPNGASFRGTKLIVTVILVSAIVVAVTAILMWWLVTKRRARVRGKANMDFSAMGLLRFSYKELVDATGNFGQQLGIGGFGAVYKGTLEDKSEVAVKTLVKPRQGEQEFRTEVAVIEHVINRNAGTVQHVNLVRLRGFCAEGDHRALVYEYIPNGSLEKYIFRKANKDGHKLPNNNVLDWKVRMNIALGAARGISYLHHECRSNIIHCDIKPENILLAGDFTPKVSDFGLAKLMGKDVSRVITQIRGTRGYLAPEWLTNSTLTSKVDVYSFGMTLLELIGGRRTVDLSLPTEKWFYAVWAYKEIARGEQLKRLLDERLAMESVDEEELRRALQVGLWCTQDDPKKRPSMRDVVKMLEGTLHVADAPAPPSYIVETDEANSGSTDQDGMSDVNKISFVYTQSFSAR